MLRNLQHVSSKLLCLESLDLIAPYLGNVCHLQRIVPYLVDILKRDKENVSVVVAQTLKVSDRRCELLTVKDSYKNNFYGP